MRALALVMLLAGCEAHVGLTAMMSLPKDAATTCRSYCSDMGLSLSSVVVMANNVGCVCSANKVAAADGAPAAAGMVTILQQEEEERHARH